MNSNKKILFWCPGNLNNINGSIEFMINSIKVFTSLKSTKLYLLSAFNINKNKTFFQLNLLANKNLIFYEPNDFGLENLIENIQLVKLIEKLDKENNFNFIFIRSFKLLKFDILNHIEKLKLVDKIILFIWYEYIEYFNHENLIKIFSIFNYFTFSSPYVLEYFNNSFNNILEKKRKIFFLPIIDDAKIDKTKNFKKDISCCYAGSFKIDYFIKEYINFFNQDNTEYKLNIFGQSFPFSNLIKNKKINYKGCLSGSQFDNELVKNQFGLSIRNAKYSNHLDVSAKLIKYMNLNILPIVNKSKINLLLLGDDYYFCNRITSINKIIDDFINNSDKINEFLKRNYEMSLNYTIENHIIKMNIFLNFI